MAINIESNLSLTLYLFLAYLKDAKIISDLGQLSWEDNSRGNLVVKVAVDPSTVNSRLGCRADRLEFIAMEMSRGEKVLLSICSDEDCLKQGVFKYHDDLLLDSIKLPIQVESVEDLYSSRVWLAFQNKFKFVEDIGLLTHNKKQSEVPSQESATTPSTRIQTEVPTAETFYGQAQSNYGRHRPSDMPGFEDEYEVQGHPGIPVSGEFGVPGLGMPSDNSSTARYGDQDLYPNGQRVPNLQDPSSQFPNLRPAKGGMIFDPFQGEGPSSNPLQRARDEKSQDPGIFPGIKYDDPYGRINRQGGGGGFI